MPACVEEVDLVCVAYRHMYRMDGSSVLVAPGTCNSVRELLSFRLEISIDNIIGKESVKCCSSCVEAYQRSTICAS